MSDAKQRNSVFYIALSAAGALFTALYANSSTASINEYINCSVENASCPSKSYKVPATQHATVDGVCTTIGQTISMSCSWQGASAQDPCTYDKKSESEESCECHNKSLFPADINVTVSCN